MYWEGINAIAIMVIVVMGSNWLESANRILRKGKFCFAG